MNNTNALKYRAAMALNNIGIALLRKGLYKEAFRAFKDAVAGMRSVQESLSASVEEGSTPTTAVSMDEDDDTKTSTEPIHRASSILCAQSRFGAITNPPFLDITEVTYHQRHTLPTLLSSDCSNNDNNNNSSCLPVVRIELEFGVDNNNNMHHHHHQLEQHEYNLIVETCVILYNLAVSILCRGVEQSRRLRQQRQLGTDDRRASTMALLDAARYQLELALQLLSTVYRREDNDDNDDQEQDEPDVFVVQLETLILYRIVALIQLQQQMIVREEEADYQQSQAASLRTRLQQNLHYLKEYDSYMNIFDVKVAAAA